MSETVAFRVEVNGGAARDLTVQTGFYISAVAAVPAILGLEEFPVEVRIWAEHLQPDYPPLTYRIEEPGGAAVIVLPKRGG